MIVVIGATGATGRLLVEQLLQRGESVTAIVRSIEALPASVLQHKNLQIIQASVLDLSDKELQDIVKDCDAVASCLGHNLSFKGLLGQPRHLVRDAIQRLSQAVIFNKPNNAVKFVLMNSTGVRNRDISESIGTAQKCVITLLRYLIPPHADNEQAADYLRTQIGPQHTAIQWVAVRPDTLIDAEKNSSYKTFASPIRSAIFDPGSTSRINVAHFMSELMGDEHLWQQWQAQMPVIYNT